MQLWSFHYLPPRANVPILIQPEDWMQQKLNGLSSQDIEVPILIQPEDWMQQRIPELGG